MAAAGVAGAQLAGRAPSSFVVGDPPGPPGHFRAACASTPLAPLVNFTRPMRVRNLLSSHLSDPIGATSRRPRAL